MSPAPGTRGRLSPHCEHRSSQHPAAMINILLALVPLAMATGFLVWVMTMGARDQARSDAWAQSWVDARGGAPR